MTESLEPRRHAALATESEADDAGAGAGLPAPRRASPAGRFGAGATGDRAAGAGRLRQDHGAGGRRPPETEAGRCRRVAVGGRGRCAERARRLHRVCSGAGRSGADGGGGVRNLERDAGCAAAGDAGSRRGTAGGPLSADPRRGRLFAATKSRASGTPLEARSRQSARGDGVAVQPRDRPSPPTSWAAPAPSSAPSSSAFRRPR